MGVVGLRGFLKDDPQCGDFRMVSSMNSSGLRAHGRPVLRMFSTLASSYCLLDGEARADRGDIAPSHAERACT